MDETTQPETPATVSSEPSKPKSHTVPWWSWPAIAASSANPCLAANVVNDVKLLKKLPIGQLIPVLAVLIAVWFGTFTPGFEQVYTESMPFLVFALVLGLMFSSLGVLFVVTFSVFDLVRFFPDFSLGGLGGRLISYWLLWLLVVEIPGIVSDFTDTARKGAMKLPHSANILSAILTGAVVYVWMLGEPLLIRPFFTWAGTVPTVQAVFTVQILGYILVAVGAITAYAAGMMRSYYSSLLPESSGSSGPLQTISRYLLPVMLVGGVISNIADLVFLVVGVLVAHMVSGKLVAMPSYDNSVGKIPRIYRFLMAFGLTLVVSFIVMQVLYTSVLISEFFPHVLVVIAGFFIFGFFVGEPSTKKLPKEVGVAVLVLFLFGAFPAVALADNCGGRTDCNGTARGAAAAAAGAGAAAAGLGKGKGKGKGKDGKGKEKDAMDKAKEITDKLQKVPVGPKPVKWVIKKWLEKLYETARGVSDGMQGETN